MDGLIHWGNEVWNCGTSHFETVIAEGADIWLRSIQGAVTATPRHSANRTVQKNFWGDSPENYLQRQSLVVLHHDGATQAHTTTPTAAQPANNQVDQGLFAVNAKTYGPHPVVVPINYRFDPPIRVPAGKLKLRVDTEGHGPLDLKTTDCLNTETHMTIQWSLEK